MSCHLRISQTHNIIWETLARLSTKIGFHHLSRIVVLPNIPCALNAIALLVHLRFVIAVQKFPSVVHHLISVSSWAISYVILADEAHIQNQITILLFWNTPVQKEYLLNERVSSREKRQLHSYALSFLERLPCRACSFTPALFSIATFNRHNYYFK